MAYFPIHDLDLIRRFADSGDEEIFAEIVRKYSGLVYAACHRILGDRLRAEEASQEAFFQLLQNASKVSGSLAGWLHTIATRISINIANRDHIPLALHYLKLMCLRLASQIRKRRKSVGWEVALCMSVILDPVGVREEGRGLLGYGAPCNENSRNIKNFTKVTAEKFKQKP